MTIFWFGLGMFALGGTIGVILMGAVAGGKMADLEAEIGQYQARVRRLADDCHCTCGDGA